MESTIIVIILAVYLLLLAISFIRFLQLGMNAEKSTPSRRKTEASSGRKKKTEHPLDDDTVQDLILTAPEAEVSAVIAEAAENRYLTLTALEAGASVTFGYISGTDVEYSKDGGEHWEKCPSGTSVTLEEPGDSVCYRGNNVKTKIDRNFSMTGRIEAGGCATSLVNRSGGNCPLEPYQFHNLFMNCTGLEKAPELPSEKLATGCYSSMFEGCTGLTEAPVLPALVMAFSCYSYMFSGCTNLKKAPELPSEKLAENCYQSMFWKCTSLTAAPVLPARELAEGCYSSMFYNCTGLTEAPELPSEQLAERCYSSMFYKCRALRKAPALPAKILTKSCYALMFYYCTGLEKLPELSGVVQAENCYMEMFTGTKVAAENGIGGIAD